MKRNIAAVLLIGILAGLLGGCAGWGARPDQVRVHIADIQPLESTLMEQRFLIKLRIQNRSDRVLQADGLSFDLRLNGRDFASGVSNKDVRIEPLSEATMEVAASSTLFGLLRQLRAAQRLRHKPFSYVISGKVHTAGGIGSIPFRETGEIDLAEAVR